MIYIKRSNHYSEDPSIHSNLTTVSACAISAIPAVKRSILHQENFNHQRHQYSLTHPHLRLETPPSMSDTPFGSSFSVFTYTFAHITISIPYCSSVCKKNYLDLLHKSLIQLLLRIRNCQCLRLFESALKGTKPQHAVTQQIVVECCLIGHCNRW